MKKFFGIAVVVGAVVAGAAVGYKFATDSNLRERMVRNAKDALHVSKQRMDEMTEEVALKTARVTKNPKINQDWVDKQWEAVI